MTPGKLQSAALFFTIFATMLILPPLVLLFNLKARFLGLPAEMIYLFVVWMGLAAGTAWFAYRLPHEPGLEKSEDLE